MLTRPPSSFMPFLKWACYILSCRCLDWHPPALLEDLLPRTSESHATWAQIPLVPYSSFLLDFFGYHDFFTLLGQASLFPPFPRPKTYLPLPVGRALLFHFLRAKLSSFSIYMDWPISFYGPSSLLHFGPQQLSFKMIKKNKLRWEYFHLMYNHLRIICAPNLTNKPVDFWYLCDTKYDQWKTGQRPYGFPQHLFLFEWQFFTIISIKIRFRNQFQSFGVNEVVSSRLRVMPKSYACHMP